MDATTGLPLWVIIPLCVAMVAGESEHTKFCAYKKTDKETVLDR